jgi:hypothetical protein
MKRIDHQEAYSLDALARIGLRNISSGFAALRQAIIISRVTIFSATRKRRLGVKTSPHAQRRSSDAADGVSDAPEKQPGLRSAIGSVT